MEYYGLWNYLYELYNNLFTTNKINNTNLSDSDESNKSNESNESNKQSKKNMNKCHRCKYNVTMDNDSRYCQKCSDDLHSTYVAKYAGYPCGDYRCSNCGLMEAPENGLCPLCAASDS